MTDVNGMLANNISNMNSFRDLIVGANQSGAGYFFSALDFLVFMVLFITLTGQFGWESAMLSSGFVGLILTLLFVYMGVMQFWIAGAFAAVIILMMLIIILGNKYD